MSYTSQEIDQLLFRQGLEPINGTKINGWMDGWLSKYVKLSPLSRMLFGRKQIKFGYYFVFKIIFHKRTC